MCGIVGVLSSHQAAPILTEGLRRLEYRGYDSAGIATVSSGRLDRRRAVGKLVNLSDLLVMEPLPGKAGIGHTRWATHGAPTVGNAHPHRAGRVAVVHNGIIENFRDLRDDLAAHGVGFETDTDTETIALLCQNFLDQGLAPVAAADATIKRLDGAYALVFLFEGEDDLLVACRKGSPLAVGHGEGEVFVGSDALALSPFTDRVTYLEEGDRAVLTRQSIEIVDMRGKRANREIRQISGVASVGDKGGFKHFMAKEIAEQPTALADTLAAYIGADGNVRLPDQGIDLSIVSKITLVACGTAYLACLTAKYWLESRARLPVDVDIASEYRYREPPVSEGTLAIFASQSGETADTLAALRYIADKAAQTVALVNSPESSIARECDLVLPLHVGPEIGVASTKAFTGMLTVFSALAVKAAHDRGLIDAGTRAALTADLARLPGLMHQALSVESTIAAVSRRLAEARDILFLGRGQMVDPTVPVIVMAPRDRLFDKSVSNMQEVMAREGRVLLISDASGILQAGDGVWASITMPEMPEELAPIVYAIPAQLLAYHTAVVKGTDVDQPRNLAKSVTVE